MKQYLLFDLDGTLTDPKEGITTCVQYALAAFGIDEPDLDKLEPFIGPPLKDSFMEFYQMTEEQAEAAIEKYRERFRDTGIFENEVYGGIYDLLRTMKAAGMHMAVVSSKPTVFVERILKHFKMDQYFEVVLGSELDGTRTKKAQVIIEVLRKFFGEKPIQYDQIYMIGDRKYDVEGARAFHIESVGVTYGYGSIEELKEAKADYIVQSVSELKKLLMREVDEKKQMDEVHRAQNPGSTKKVQNQGTKIVWRIILLFLLFILSKTAVRFLLSIVCQYLSANEALASYLLVKQEENVVLTGLAGVLIEALSVGFAGLFIIRYAMPIIQKASEEMKLIHLKKEPVKNYVFLGCAALGLVVGFVTLVMVLGFDDVAKYYRETHGTVHDIPFLLGLLSFGVCTPFAEQLMFTGIMYNGVKKFMAPKVSVLVTAIFYGYYRGYSIQMFYSIAICALIIYAYDYFGDFRVALGLHVFINILYYLITSSVLTQAPIYNWPVCGIAFVLLIVGLVMLRIEKKKAN